MNTPKPKSGFLSSEFYITLGNTVAGIAVMLGYLTPQQADDFVKAIVSVLGGLMVIISTVVYIAGRIKLKEKPTISSTPLSQTPTSEAIENLAGDSTYYPQ